MLGLRCCRGLSLAVASGAALVSVRGLLATSLAAEHGLQTSGSEVVARGLRRSEARGIFRTRKGACVPIVGSGFLPTGPQGSSPAFLLDFSI